MDNDATPFGGDGGGHSSPPQASHSPQSPPSSAPLLPRILSGSVGSLATALAVTPLEVVKIRQQTAAGADAIAPVSFRGVRVEPCPGCGTLVLNNGLMECVLPVESTSVQSSSASRAKIGGTFSTLLSIFRHEGYAGLYKGLRPTLVMSVPNTVLYFTAYDEITLRLRRMHLQYAAGNSIENENTTIPNADDVKRQSYIPLLAGSSARLLASLSTAPLELLRTRQASVVSHQHGPTPAAAPGMVEEIRLLLRSNGIGSFYVGLAPTLWRDVPFSAIYWLFLEKFRNALGDSDELGVWGGNYYRERGMKVPPGVEAGHAFVSGAAAGSIAAAFTTPFDVVKTRRQMVLQSDATAGACDHNGLKELCAKDGYTRLNNGGTFTHMRQILQQEGLPGLWKGNVTRMVKVAPACAIMISCYEFGKRVFGDML
ncbi:hypothetical protein ACHAXT_003398 [Thalassiosira profunda]